MKPSMTDFFSGSVKFSLMINDDNPLRGYIRLLDIKKKPVLCVSSDEIRNLWVFVDLIPFYKFKLTIQIKSNTLSIWLIIIILFEF